ncbi:hypothetical protein CONPUDRAFT_73361 [Coniophora puteana RWD-64-598 SS2]|uniref:Uncharacterized protein n=1 Tax=Coniophora puteana (strain RWD-64-598) TaxID=741705 RepID=A0A5M3MLX7_CONPW|nr:uncharacterized protein CONPUDRAFT_73361 [Coniophora puteana RWD-64-598 SS2]EIW80178.1 hypothetical protein CONPUDRAFT_73361 [Coniophora puteana RWD-64-598 SS2]
MTCSYVYLRYGGLLFALGSLSIEHSCEALQISLVVVLQVEEAIVLGTPGCFTFAPISPYSWPDPLNVALSLAYEVTLIVMVIYRSYWQLRDHQKHSALLGVKSITSLISRHGLLYFLFMILYGISDTINVARLNSSPLGLSSTTESMVTSMLGPWFIISIREPDVIRQGSDSGLSRDAMSSVAFRRSSDTPGYEGAGIQEMHE